MKHKVKRTLRILFAAFALSLLGLAFSYAASSEYTPISVSLNGTTVSDDAWEFKGTPYIALSTLKEYGDCSSFKLDESASKIWFELKDMNIHIADDETTAFIKENAGTCYMFIKQIDGKKYVALNAITQFAKLGYEFDGKTVYLAPYKNAKDLATVSADCNAAESLISGDGKNISLKKGQIVRIVNKGSFSTTVKTLAGDTAYVASSRLSAIEDTSALLDFQYSAKTKPVYSDKVNLVWHNMAGTTLEPPDKTGGIDIVAPTWCRLIVNGKGDVTNYCNGGYVDSCHDRGWDVWLCITNSMGTSGATNYTSTVLENKSLRNKAIAQYLFYSALYNIDGINVDYESMKDSVRDNYTAFVTTLGSYARRMGLTYSVCLPPVASWYVEYDYQAIADAVDYITLMTYDQSTGSAGPCAAYDWVESSINNLLEYCPASKIMMGIPFYTRMWSGSKSSKSVSISSAKAAVSSWGVTPSWNSTLRLYYAESGANKVWLEDIRSIANKLTLVYKYNLAGSCCWSQATATDELYDLFNQVYKQHVDPDTITPAFF